MELINKRSLNSKHFLNTDGSITAQIGLTPIHYIDDNNQYDDIDLNIISETNWEFEYAVKKNNFRAYFNDSTDIQNSTLASFEIKNANGVFRWINYKLYGAIPINNTIDGNKIKYAEVFPNIDLEYVVNSVKLKENIIIKQPVSNFSYTFTLKLSEGLRLEQQADGSIFFIDTDTQEVLWSIEKPYAEDNNGLRTENVGYTLGKQVYGDIEYNAITATVNDNEFLTNAVYPIVIDPTTTYGITLNGDDGYAIYSSNGSIYSLENVLYNDMIVGYDDITAQSNHIFLRFTNVNIPTNVNVDSAYIKLYNSEINNNTLLTTINYVTQDSPAMPTFSTFDGLPLAFCTAWNIPAAQSVIEMATSDIKSAIQALVNRAGWVSGNPMLFVIKNGELTGVLKRFYTREAKNGRSPTLEVTYTVNTAPTTPGAFTSPTGTLQGGTQITASWGASTDAEGNLAGYKLNYAIDGGAYGAEIDCISTSYNMTVPSNNTLQFRVRAYDSSGAYSDYVYSSIFNITNIVDKTASDVITITITETSSMDMSLTTSETTTVTYTESAILDVNTSGTDPPILSVVETSIVDIGLITEDVNNINVSEISSLDIQLFTTDSIMLTAFETNITDTNVSGVDIISVLPFEISELNASSTVSDTINISDEETSIIDKELYSDENITISTEEYASYNIDAYEVNTEENFIIDLTETTFINNQLNIVDTISLAVNETYNLNVNTDNEDKANLVINEVSTLQLIQSDNTILSISEISSLTVYSIAFDILNVDPVEEIIHECHNTSEDEYNLIAIEESQVADITKKLIGQIKLHGNIETIRLQGNNETKFKAENETIKIKANNDSIRLKVENNLNRLRGEM